MLTLTHPRRKIAAGSEMEFAPMDMPPKGRKLHPQQAERAKRVDEIRELRKKGWGITRIGDHYGLSRQRIHQLLDPHGRYRRKTRLVTQERRVALAQKELELLLAQLKPRPQEVETTRREIALWQRVRNLRLANRRLLIAAAEAIAEALEPYDQEAKGERDASTKSTKVSSSVPFEGEDWHAWRTREMRRLHEQGLTLKAIGRKFGITGPRVGQILKEADSGD